MSGLYSLILAGGQGSRLWPLSRIMAPKQMFKFTDENSLFQQTFLKLATIVDDKNIFTVTNVKYVSEINEQLKTLKDKFCRRLDYTVLSEPISKDTASAITLGVKYIIDNYNSNSVIIVVPSDQLFLNRIEFADFISKGIKLAQNGYIVSFVSQTDKFNENLDYVKIRKNTKISEIEPEAFKVSSFVDKLSSKDVNSHNSSKLFLNSGIYMFTAQTYLSELKKHYPDLFVKFKNEYPLKTIPSVSLNFYNDLTDITIEDVLMKKTGKLAAINLNTKWFDVGSWDVVYDISLKDSDGNVIRGNAIQVDSKDSLLYSTSKLVTAIGLNNTIVAETPDAVLVCDKNNTNEVKKIYKKLNEKNYKTKEIHKTVFRPWGYYTVLENGNGFLTKCITVNPISKLSLQLHHHRSEHWIVLEGEATVIKGDITYKLSPGESIDIEIEEVHSLQNLGEKQLKIIEIQQGDILDENDIVRLEDIYGRV